MHFVWTFGHKKCFSIEKALEKKSSIKCIRNMRRFHLAKNGALQFKHPLAKWTPTIVYFLCAVVLSAVVLWIQSFDASSLRVTCFPKHSFFFFHIVAAATNAICICIFFFLFARCEYLHFSVCAVSNNRLLFCLMSACILFKYNLNGILSCSLWNTHTERECPTKQKKEQQQHQITFFLSVRCCRCVN